MIVLSRGSPLAKVQTEEALRAIRHLFPASTQFEVRFLQTPGDRDLRTPLSDPSVPDDFFTRDLDEAIRRGEGDLAVHSAKDLPQRKVPGLVVAALLRARDIRDALVFRKGVEPDAVRVIGVSSPKRIAEITKLYPEAEQKPLRGSIEQRLHRLDSGEFDAVIMAACALERLGLAARIGRFLPYDPTPQQGRLAIVVREDRTDLIEILKAVDVRRTAGLVAIVGCPAVADLLSHRAERYLNQADIILHDRLVPAEILQAHPGRLVCVGKTGGGPSTPQVEIHRRMLHEAEAGKLVVRLHGGDPGIYGHLGEEIEFLSAWNLRYDIVPAPTAAQIAAARAPVALTHRGYNPRITLATARPGEGFDDQPFPGPDVGPLAIYMGVLNAAEVAEKLRLAGWVPDTSVLVAERLGYSDERITRIALADLPRQAIEPPATFLIGLRTLPPPSYALFTGTEPDHFLVHGPLLHWPMIQLEPVPSADRVAALEGCLDNVRGILFPSRFAVRVFFEALFEIGDARRLQGKRILAVGPATAEELSRWGLKADRAADSLGGVRALAERMEPADAGRYLYPCSDAAPIDDRRATLAPTGIELEPVIFYRNVPAPERPLPRLPFDRVIFTSASAVRVYFERYPSEKNEKRRWLAVGPSTLASLRARGLAGELLREA